jgi:TonB family protein
MLLIGAGSWAADDSNRRVLYREDPEYPQIAAKMSLHGTVKLKVWIAPDGTIRRLEYVGGHPLLAESAVKAVKHWKYNIADKETSQVVEVKF